MSTFNKPRDVDLSDLDKGAQDINENFDKLFLILRRSPIGPGGVVDVPGGGTGLGTIPIGDLLVGTGTAILGLLPDVALGNALISGGVGAAPTYGKINLTLHVTAVLPIANGGTNGATKTAGFDNLSPTTTKGDLIAHDGTNNVRVPVGTDGFTLVADAAEPAGVKWAEGGGTHEMLEQAVHTDADTQTRQLGDLIAAQGPSELAAGWLDGLPGDQVATNLDTSGEDYWLDGLPGDEISGGASATDVLWRRVPIGTPNQVLTSNGTTPEWRDPGTVTEIVATSQPRVRVYATGNASIASGAGTDSPLFGGTRVAFAGESFDTDSFHSTVTNTSRLTVPAGKGGTYLIVAQASWETSATGRKACWIVKNNTFRAGISEVCGDDGGLNLSHSATALAELAAGDYIELHVRQDSGGTLQALGGTEADGLCSLAMYKLP